AFEFFPSTQVTLTQHLLNGVGLVPNLSNTWIAEGNERISELNLSATKNAQAYAVAIAYWDLVEAREDFKVLQRQQDLAEEALKLAQNRADAGLGTRLDVLAQQSNLATLKRSLIQAEYLVEQRTDELVRAIHPDLLVGYSLFSNYRVVIETTTQVQAELTTAMEPSLINELKGALRKRPEISAARQGIENAGLAITRDEYGLLPTLDLSGNFVVNGLGATANDSFESYTDFTNLDYGFALTFGVPLQNRAARAGLDSSVIRKRQAILDAREAETDVIMEVAAAVRGINSAKRGVAAAQEARDFADATHKAEVERNKAGLATAFEVKQALNDLTAAERDLIRSRIEAEKARLALLKATGELGQ
ncbi:MAG: TolC family protein, partial [Planctomycetes bacterium]|nr:TolC family protein [Planctomycetota bacterium]